MYLAMILTWNIFNVHIARSMVVFTVRSGMGFFDFFSALVGWYRSFQQDGNY